MLSLQHTVQSPALIAAYEFLNAIRSNKYITQYRIKLRSY
jgi:hypothetical protein